APRPRTEPTKKAAAVSHPGVMRSFGECSFLEDSRYASQIIFVASKPARRFVLPAHPHPRMVGRNTEQPCPARGEGTSGRSDAVAGLVSDHTSPICFNKSIYSALPGAGGAHKVQLSRLSRGGAMSWRAGRR